MRKLIPCFFILLSTVYVFSQSCNCLSGSCTLTSSIPFQSSYASGKYSIFYGNIGPSNVLDKPLILLEPLDFSDTATCWSFYHSGSQLLFDLQNLGYDVVYLDFDQNLDFLERNAMLTVELLNQINQTKIGAEPLLVVGENTSAVNARYALTYMEEHNMRHQVQAYISIDGAHRGFNIPLGLQIFIEEMYNQQLLLPYSLQFHTLMNKPLIKEMLIYSVPGYHNTALFPGTLFNHLFDSLHLMNSCYGYPKQCKKNCFL